MTVSFDEREQSAQLLARAAGGDQHAFAELYRLTSARLFGVCLRMLRHRSEAEEVLQEVYTTVWRRAQTFDPARAGALTWLVTLTRHKAIDRLRQRRENVLQDPVELEYMADEQAGPAADAEASEEYRRLRHCLEQLNPQQRQSVREAFFSGATYNELAVRCQAPLGTVKSWIRRGLIQLRTCLDS